MIAKEDVLGFHLYTVRRALFGITIDAIQVLEECAMFVAAGIPLPAAHARWLWKRLNEIAKSGDPWGKPLFARKPGQKARDQYDRQERIAREVWSRHDKRGETLEKAKAAAALKFSVSEDTAENHYRKFLPRFRK